MTCRYDKEQDSRQAALVVGLCLAACLMVVAASLLTTKDARPAPAPPEPECWDAVTMKPCDEVESTLRDEVHKALRKRRKP